MRSLNPHVASRRDAIVVSDDERHAVCQSVRRFVVVRTKMRGSTGRPGHNDNVVEGYSSFEAGNVAESDRRNRNVATTPVPSLFLPTYVRMRVWRGGAGREAKASQSRCPYRGGKIGLLRGTPGQQ